MNVDSGSVTGQADETGASPMLAKCQLDRESKSGHWGQERIGGSWDDIEKGDTLKYEALAEADFQEMWKTISTKEAHPEAVTGDVAAKVTWKDRQFVISGKVNGRVDAIDFNTGRTVLSMAYYDSGEVNFYRGKVNLYNRASTREDRQASDADNAFCGMLRPGETPKEFTTTEGNNVVFSLDPKVIRSLPVSLFAVLYLYSNSAKN